MALIAGIDPGTKGAIAVVDEDDKCLEDVMDMPFSDKSVDAVAVRDFLRAYEPLVVYIEAQNSFGMGRQTAFNFGQYFNAVKVACDFARVPYKLVNSKDWKKHMALTPDKEKSLNLARSLFPDKVELFKRKKDDGRAEAALIALYGVYKECPYGE